MGQNQVKEKEPINESTPILMQEVNLTEKPTMESEFELHFAAYLGELEKVQKILESDDKIGDSIVREVAREKRTPLHSVAFGGRSNSSVIAKLFLDYDKNDKRNTGETPLVNLQDEKGKTALHYAASSKQPELIELLQKYGADPNIQDGDGYTPLHIAAKGNSDAAVECVKLLLHFPSIRKYEACPSENKHQTAVHIAAFAKADVMLKYLLNKGFNHSSPDSEGCTPLHLAARSGDSPGAVGCVKELLRVCNTDETNAKTGEGQTALHIASYMCHQQVLAVLLDDIKTDILIKDNKMRTALHCAVEAWFKTHSMACVKLLLESPKISDWQSKAVFLFGNRDANKETAMDIAIKHRAIRIAEYLIQAHPDPEAWLRDDLLEKIYSILPEAIIPLMDAKGLSYNPALFHERNESIDVHFGPIVGYTNPVENENVDEESIRQETKYLRNILYSPKEIQRSVLLHPLVQIFIDLKWKKIRPITWLAIGFQFVWLLLYTTLVFEIYVPDCPRDEPVNSTQATTTANNTTEEKKLKALKILLSLGFFSKETTNLDDCTFLVGPAASISAVLFFMSAIIVVKEIFQMKNNSNYFWDASNWGQWTLLIVFVINTIPAFQESPEINNWQFYLAAFGAFLAWVLSLREIAKFPNCGIYAAILKKVFWHCLKMLIFYFPLLVAFAVCLRILLPGKGQYTYFLFAIVKVVIMMTGELDFDDSFYENGPDLALNAIFSQLVFLLLVFITTIVLLNLLTGLAVNDVQSLIEEAEINRLSNELEQIHLFESLILFLRKTFGEEHAVNFFHKLNVTSISYPEFTAFVVDKSGVETKSYSQDLKQRIKRVMVAVEGRE